ncbi:MAG: potassium channel family protein [Crocinitomicaceae bacterium]
MTHWKIFRRFYFIAFLLLLIFSIGVGGFMIIENWNFFDSFYMTVITITTVGFGEIHPLSSIGRIFTSFLILGTFGTIAYLISTITSLIYSGELGRNIKKYKLIDQINVMENHVVVCGLGRVGIQVANDLKFAGFKVIVIEEKTEGKQDLLNSFPSVSGDATRDEVLNQANIEKARSLIACLPNDADNLFIVLTAKAINPNLQIISRASQRSSVAKIKMAGAHHVIMPDSIGGTHMASIVSTPEVIEFLDQIRLEGQHGANIEGISFDQLPEKYRGKTLLELDLKKQTGATIVGFKSNDGSYAINPEESTRIEEKSTLFVLGNAQQIKNVNQFFELI